MPDKKIKIKKRPVGQRVNPRIAEVEIGIRNLRKVKVYPLSMNDQKELTKLINEILKSIFSGGEEGKDEKEQNLIFISRAVKVVEENIAEVLKFVLPDESNTTKLMKDLDNQQLSDIVKIVYQVNYETPVKNVTSLFPTEQLQSVLKRQQLPSANDMDTD